MFIVVILFLEGNCAAGGHQARRLVSAEREHEHCMTMFTVTAACPRATATATANMRPHTGKLVMEHG